MDGPRCRGDGPRRRLSEGEGNDEPTRKILAGFGLGRVCDVAQTDGEPLAEGPTPQELEGTSDISEAVDRRLSRFLIGEGVRLTKEDAG